MAIPSRVPTRGPSPRLAIGAVALVAVALVGIGYLGRDAGPTEATPTPVAEVATPAPATPEPTPVPPVAFPPGPVTARVEAASALDEPPELVPTGLVTVAPIATIAGAVVAADGAAWVAGAGSLARLDAASEDLRTWSIDDDARFSIGTIAPARDAGIWIVGEGAVRRFDGAGFPEGYRLARQPIVAAEAADGVLWVACSDGSVVGLDGAIATWIHESAGGVDLFPTALVTDASGGIWLGGVTGEGLDVVMRFDGSGWTQIVTGIGPTGIGARSIVPLADGGAWMVVGRTLVRSGGGFVSTFIPYETPVPTSVAVAPDGTRWLGFVDLEDGSISVERIDGATSERWRRADGGDFAGSGDAQVLVAGARAYLATPGGLYRFEAGAWRELLATGATDGELTTLLAVSAKRAYVMTASGIDEVFATGTRRPILRPEERVTDLALDRDGRLWVSSTLALYRRTGSTWTTVADDWADAIAAHPDGGIVALRPDPAGGFVVARYGVRAPGPLRSELLTGASRIAVGRDGTIRVGSAGIVWSGAGLASHRAGTWTLADIRGAQLPLAILGLATGADGDVWIVGQDIPVRDPARSRPLPAPPSWFARLRDGRWTSWAAPDPSAGWLGRPSVSVGPDGRAWFATAHGLLATDGASWTATLPELAFHAVSVAPDGTIWTTGPGGVARLPAGVLGEELGTTP